MARRRKGVFAVLLGVTLPSAPLAAPVKTGSPTISSPTLNVGDTATAVRGTYTGSVTAYSGQWYRGATLIPGATGLTYVFVSADLGLNITYQESASNPVGSSATGTSNALGPIANGSALATPTLTNSSALGAAPLVLSVTAADYTAGLYLQLQIDQTSSAFSNISQNLVFLVDGASWAALDEAVGLVTPSGQYWSRVRAVRDDEGGSTTVSGTDPSSAAISFLADVSAWSNTFTDTISASSAVLATVTGTNKNSGTTISGSPALTFANASTGSAKNCARTLVEQATSHAQFEVTQNSGGATANYVIGIDDGTTNLNTDAAPGVSTNTGIALNIALGAYLILNWNSSGNQFNFINNVAGTVQDGDIFTLDYDYTNGTMDCWRTRSGVTTKMGGQATGLPTLTHHYAFAGSLNTTVSGTLNFGGTAYAHTPVAGAASVWA